MPKTVQLRDDTYARLRAYKVGGMTFDDVVRKLMDEKLPEDFHAEYREWQRQVAEGVRRGPGWEEL